MTTPLIVQPFDPSVLDLPALITTREAIAGSPLAQRLAREPVERLLAILVNEHYRPLTVHELVIGDAHQMHLRLRDTRLPLLLLGADVRGLLLLHNHPQHRAYPSAEDVETTAHIAALADLLGVTLLDHCIVARQHLDSAPSEHFCFSMAETRKFSSVLRPTLTWVGGFRSVTNLLSTRPDS